MTALTQKYYYLEMSTDMDNSITMHHLCKAVYLSCCATLNPYDTIMYTDR